METAQAANMRLSESLEHRQSVSDSMGDAVCVSDAIDVKRAELRSLGGAVAIEPETDSRVIYREHLLQKHGAGMRR